MRSDNHSAVVDPKTFEITGHVSFVPLVWQELQVALYDEVVSKRGGRMIANSMPATRTVMEAGIRNNVVQFIESAAKGRESWGHAYTPVGLAKALFQLSDPDPAYSNVTGKPVDNLWADLDFGTLTYMYDMLLPNATGWEAGKQNVMQHIFASTVVELGPGFVVAKERIVTKMARNFTWSGNGGGKLRVRHFDRDGWQTGDVVVRGPTVFAGVDGGGARSFAVIDDDSSEDSQQAQANIKVDDETVDAGADAEQAACRCLPTDACWKKVPWASLNASVEGRLMGFVDEMEPCITNVTSTACNATLSNDTAYWLADQTNGLQNSAFFGAWNISTDHSAFVVRAEAEADFQATVSFAHTHNLRLVVKNTGHGRFLQQERLHEPMVTTFICTDIFTV